MILKRQQGQLLPRVKEATNVTRKMSKALRLLFIGKPSHQTDLKTYKHLSISFWIKSSQTTCSIAERRDRMPLLSADPRENCASILWKQLDSFISSRGIREQHNYYWKMAILCTTENITPLLRSLVKHLFDDCHASTVPVWVKITHFADLRILNE